MRGAIPSGPGTGGVRRSMIRMFDRNETNAFPASSPALLDATGEGRIDD